jgi:hypothetical protein
VATLHPRHTAASVRSLLERFHYFKQGNCIVHHMFGDDVRTLKCNRFHYLDQNTVSLAGT